MTIGTGFIWFYYIAGLAVVLMLLTRLVRIKRLPINLRWELAPVPHEKNNYGGSYFETFEWWTKPRETSMVREAVYMFKEIILLKGVWENQRSLWWFSFPLHFAIYLLFAMFGLALVSAVLVVANRPEAGGSLSVLITFFAVTGFGLGTVGAIGMLFMRSLSGKLRRFSTTGAFLNLFVLAAVFVSGIFALRSVGPFAEQFVAFLQSLLTYSEGEVLDRALQVHVVIAMCFWLYLPLTHMTHFIAKYFTYHHIRWGDEPLEPGGAVEGEVGELLKQKVTWAAPHIQSGGKLNWVEVATKEEKK